MNSLLLLISGLILPILLWPIEYFLPYPHVIEEGAKFLILWFLKQEQPKSSKKKDQTSLKIVILFALFFTLSESILYMMNFFLLWQIDLFPKRLFLTGLLHVTTVLILFFGLKKNKLWQSIALLISIGIHYIYNNLIVLLL